MRSLSLVFGAAPRAHALRPDSLDNLTEETGTPEGGTPYTTSSLHNNKGFRTQLDPPGGSNTVIYAQILLAVDVSLAGESPPYYPYVALRIAPDRVALIAYDGTEDVEELDTADIETAQNVWYTVHAVFDEDDVQVYRTSETLGDPVAELSGESDLLDGLGGEAETAGFAVGAAAGYHFRSLGYATTGTASTAHVAWTYDPFGRKAGRTVYDGSGAVTSETHYVYDGWRLVQERDAGTGTVLAEYTYGPGYIDDVLRSSRGGQEYYHHTDQQHSTIALTNAAGAVVERYAYDAFGAPTVCDSAGSPIGTSAVDNPVLYTGRTWDPALNLYDYRNRQYDPALGRFTTPDPLGPNADWNNLGNPYTYTGGNPGAFVDPFGTESYEHTCRLHPTNIWWGLKDLFTNPFGRGGDVPVSAGAPQAPVVTSAHNRYDPNADVLTGSFGRKLPGVEGAPSGYMPETGAELAVATQQAAAEMRTYVQISTMVGPSGVAAGVELADAAINASQGEYGQVIVNGIILGTLGKGLASADDIVGAAKARKVSLSTLRDRFRKGLMRITPPPPGKVHAHHIFPIALEPDFAEIGIDIWDPRYATWWEMSEHCGRSRKWNATWMDWLEKKRAAGTVTREMALRHGRKMARKAGLRIHF